MDADGIGGGAALVRRGPRRLLLFLRLAVVVLVVVYFLSPDGVQVWLPVWLPFLAALAVELHFFVTGLRAGGRRRHSAGGRGPQARDLAELGWAGHTVEVAFEDATLVLHGRELEPDELAAWIDRNADGLTALGPGRHELGPAEADGGVRLWEPPAATVERPRGGSVQAALVLALVAAALLLAASQRRGWDSLDGGERAAAARLVSAEAGRIAARQATVTCDEQGARVGYVQDADGLAEVGGRRAWLAPSICFTLYRLSEGHRVPDGVGGRAIAVLAHEAWHLRGISDEGVANCYAFQSGVSLGLRLGLSDERAAALMRSQVADNLAVANPPYRVPEGCVDGGRYDLAPAASRFP